MSISSSCVNKPVGLSTFQRVSAYLTWSASSSFVRVFVLISKRLTDTGTQQETGLPVISLVLSQSRQETCIDFLSTRTARLFCHNGSPRSNELVQKIGLGFGWVGWESLLIVEQLLNPILSSNHCLYKEIFGSGRGDVHIVFRVWFLQFPSWTAFGMQYVGSVLKRKMAFDRVW